MAKKNRSRLGNESARSLLSSSSSASISDTRIPKTAPVSSALPVKITATAVFSPSPSPTSTDSTAAVLRTRRGPSYSSVRNGDRSFGDGSRDTTASVSVDDQSEGIHPGMLSLAFYVTCE